MIFTTGRPMESIVKKKKKILKDGSHVFYVITASIA
jgi:hypothetical protein